MTDVLRLVLIILLMAVCFAAYFLVIGAFFPKRVANAQRVINQMAWRSLAVGFVNFLFFGVILAVLLTITDGNANRVNSVVRVVLLIPTLVLAALFIAVLSFGLAGMVNVLGERLLPESNALKRSVSGTVILTFSCALPFVGWFLLLPYVALTGFGAVILGFFQREP
ncbi:MAG: hypothetical protein L0287_27015 [Anaerolineae bacterium]|nr:hypothetical protein [Anaerolineae bacterium]